MKNIFKLLLIALMALCICGCTNDAPEILEPDGPETIDTGFSGTFYSYTNMADDPYSPNVVFSSDGTFVFEENVYEGMLTLKGTYKIEGSQIICDVTENSLSGFAGEDVKEIKFFMTDKNNLTILTDICMTSNSDEFKTTKKDEIMDGGGPSFTEDVYYLKRKDVEPEFWCTLYLRSDGSFTLMENYYEGIAEINGTYTSDGNTIVCIPDDLCPYKKDVPKIEFEIINEGTLRSKTFISMTEEGSEYYK